MIWAVNKGYFLELQPDSDGNIICPVCDQKFSSDINWDNHLEDERKWLINRIEK